MAIHYHESERGARELADRLLEQGPERAQTFRADLRDPEEAGRLPKRVVEAMGRLDVLINSAAVMHAQPFGRVTPDAWDAVLDLNLRASFFTAQGASSALRAARGRIVNISDVAAFEPWPNYLPHCVSKAGLEMLTKGLARVLAPEVMVNAVAPGPVLLPETWDQQAREQAERSTPLKRIGRPEDVLAAVRFLLEADYTTGATIVVDGGRLVR